VHLTLEQIAGMAPDPAAAAAGKSLATVKYWTELGRSESALWGKCQGSAVYQVKVDLVQIAFNCTCPSRKIPCKHVLAVLMLAVQSPEQVAPGEPPAWVVEWLLKRRAREEKLAAPKEEAPPSPADAKARERRTDGRNRKVQDGLDRLDLWLKDSVRAGLLDLAAKPASVWEEQAKRLVDAQAPGLAGRVARLASLPRSLPDSVPRLLGELGRIMLLIHAYARIDQIEPPLASEIRQILGWNVTSEVLEREGEQVLDHWVVTGQWDDDGERIATRRSWLIGRRTARMALVLQFSVAGQRYDESIVVGTEQQGTLLFYPGASGQRARFRDRQGTPSPVRDRLPGHETHDDFLTGVAESLARQPWLTAFGGVLRDVTIARSRSSWWVCDKHSKALPVLGQDHWKAMAITGGLPADMAFEWDGYALRILGGLVAGRYWSL
jgi:SWIM zinc finger